MQNGIPDTKSGEFLCVVCGRPFYRAHALHQTCHDCQIRMRERQRHINQRLRGKRA